MCIFSGGPKRFDEAEIFEKTALAAKFTDFNRLSAQKRKKTISYMKALGLNLGTGGNPCSVHRTLPYTPQGRIRQSQIQTATKLSQPIKAARFHFVLMPHCPCRTDHSLTWCSRTIVTADSAPLRGRKVSIIRQSSRCRQSGFPGRFPPASRIRGHSAIGCYRG